MYNNGLVEGLSITTLSWQPGSCEDCIMGKQARCPFDGNTHPVMKLLEHIHINLWGPSCVALTGGKQYMMEAVDAYGGHTKGYFLADKEGETTLTALRDYMALAEQQTGRKVRCIHLDGGPEFCNKLWEDWCGEGYFLSLTLLTHQNQMA